MVGPFGLVVLVCLQRYWNATEDQFVKADADSDGILTAEEFPGWVVATASTVQN